MLKLFAAIFIVILFGYAPIIAICALVYIGFRQLLWQAYVFDILILFMSTTFLILRYEYIIEYLQNSYMIWESLNFTDYISYQFKHIDMILQLKLLGLIAPLAILFLAGEFARKFRKAVVKELVNSPSSDGVPLSVNPEVVLADKELNQHTLIIGTTGSGKTTTIMNFVESAAKRSLPLIFLDGKGSVDLINQMEQIASRYKRKFKVFTLRPRENINNLAGYNPFASGNATEWKNRIMSLFAEVQGKGQEHFSLGEQNYINFVATVLSKLPVKVDLRVILGFLENPDKFLALAHEIDPDLGRKIAKLHASNEVDVLIGDIAKQLNLFIYSDYGYLFNTLQRDKLLRVAASLNDSSRVLAYQDNIITLKESILNNEIVLFQFDASSYPEDTKKVAKMVINDINSSFSGFEKFTKCYCVFDEFASYASSNLAETISLQRSNGMHAVIGTQSITTVKLKSNETRRIAEELIACCNTYISQKINHYDDAVIMANIMGKSKQYEVATSYSESGDKDLANITNTHINVTDKFKITPDMLMELKTGDAIIYRKVLNQSPRKIKIRSIEIF